MSYEGLLNTTVDRYEVTLAANDIGEYEPTYSIADSGVKCRMVPVSNEIRAELPGELRDVTYYGYFLSSQTINEDDKIEYNSHNYLVMGVGTDSSGRVQRAYLKQL